MLKFIELDNENYIIGAYENKQFEGQSLVELPADFILGLYKYENNEVILDVEKQLQEAKEIKLQENETKRNERLAKGVLYKEVYFDIDADSKINIDYAVNKMAEDEKVFWGGTDGVTYIELTKAEMQELSVEIVSLTSAIWAINGLNKTYKDNINAAQTLEELNNIIINY